jgi:CHAT domain-containing protein
MVVDKPDATPTLENVETYRDAGWLLRRHAVSVLPSVTSLKALRAAARTAPAAKPIIGFGDPLFGPVEGTTGAQRAVTGKAATRSYTDYWRGAGVDRAQLSRALPQLPDTAEELEAIRNNLGAAPADIHLGRNASETAVKRAKLSDYRIVYFATHGLVAGDVKGLAEPSLALSVPREPTALDDGLLTASEIAQLKLNADWVVLSACNTAAGDKPGAEALSGLARAFFYAGTRSLLVSHWAVDSAAATRLTTQAFDVMASDPAAGRAEALRRAMLAYLEDPSNPMNAYPALWAPFSVIGEGAVR